MALTLTDEQQVKLSVAFKTAAGNPAKVQGVPAWTSSDTEIITLTVADDGMSALAVTAGPVGSSQITVTADADLGEGVREITGVETIDVLAAEAVTVGITAGEPETKPVS